MDFIPAELIKKKRDGQAHTREELSFLVDSYVESKLPDYQMAAWLMASFINGLNDEETADLTGLMKNSGATFEFGDELKNLPVDKHSTGGVGDKLSLILGPIAAAAGVPIPMIAGRGLGHTGGTLDKLEAIPGFSIDVSIEKFKKEVKEHGISLIGQTDDICPADKKIYALRDVTGTVESLPLICASIMSKKLAEGIKGLVLDVKCGSGAFMKTQKDAEALAELLSTTGARNGVNVSALITDMNQPLGVTIGNAMEIQEVNAIFNNESNDLVELERVQDSVELSLHLAGHMIWLSGISKTAEEGLEIAKKHLADGSALKAWHSLVERQGGKLDQLPKAPQCYLVNSPKSGFIDSFNTEQIGMASIVLGAGRRQKTDVIDPIAGIKIHKKIGESIEKDEPIFSLYSSNPSLFDQAEKMLLDTVTISSQATKPPELIKKVITKERF